MSAIEKIENYIERHSLVTVFLCVFLFLQPFGKLTGVKNTAFVLLMLAFALRLARGKAKIDVRDRTVQGFLALFAVSMLSALLSNYALESLDAIRKNLFYQAVVFFVIAAEYRCLEDLRPVVYSTLGGFAALSAVIVASDPAATFNWIRETEIGNKLLRGYSLYATFYIPLAIGYLYGAKEKGWIKGVIIFFVFLEFVLSVLNNHRSQLIAILASAALVTLAARRFRIFAVGGIACVIAAAAILYMKPDAFNRYKTLLIPKTYVSDDYYGLNLRVSIWKGTLDMIEERPVLGHGYGWKKIVNVAKDGGYLEKWDKKKYTYEYFSTKGYGSANPHNLVLQILFEVGALGLAAFLFIWATVVKKALTSRASKDGDGGSEAGFLRFAVFAVLASYALINYTNGLWEESYGNLMAGFAAIAVVLARRVRDSDGDH